jgi:hypothetical protein
VAIRATPPRSEAIQLLMLEDTVEFFDLALELKLDRTRGRRWWPSCGNCDGPPTHEHRAEVLARC